MYLSEVQYTQQELSVIQLGMLWIPSSATSIFQICSISYHITNYSHSYQWNMRLENMRQTKFTTQNKGSTKQTIKKRRRSCKYNTKNNNIANNIGLEFDSANLILEHDWWTSWDSESTPIKLLQLIEVKELVHNSCNQIIRNQIYDFKHELVQRS